MFYVRSCAHTVLVNKFDPDSNAILMAIIDAEKRHPKPSDGQTQRFPIWNKPLVKVRTMYGHAFGYTRSYGLIGWWDNTGKHHMEWFPADLIQRVKRADWHGTDNQGPIS